MRYSRLTVLLLLSSVACTTPPSQSVIRQPTAVNAAFTKTWDATIDMFAERTIPIKNLDRASGLIVAELASVPFANAAMYADCGTDMGAKLSPTAVSYNVLVRGTDQTTIKVNARWTRTGMSRGLSTDTVTEECGSTGLWETTFEKEVKARAEANK